MIICIEASIGAGKSSLTKYLSSYLGTTPFYEPVKHNPVLDQFYAGNKLVEQGKWKHNPFAFLLQIYFLNKRYKMMKEALSNDNNILDRSWYGDVVLARLNYVLGNMTKAEWNVYYSLFENMKSELPYCSWKKRPDLMIFIHTSLQTELARIEKRGRKFEQLDYDPNLLNYYKKLRKAYSKWFKNYHASPKMVINGDKYDYVNSLSDRKIVLHQIKCKLEQVRKK